MRRLTATYRLQLNAGFTLSRARALVGYFERLGVSHLYCSPILAARTGSPHGYDVVDPARINPELGTEDDLLALASDLHAKDMGLVLDIVPNHMGMSAENRYWDDVLMYGERSRYARWFDIDWSANAAGRRKLVLPILGHELDHVIAQGELSVRLEPDNTPRIAYFDRSYPIDPSTLPPDLQLAQFDPEETRELATLYSGANGGNRLRALLEAQHYQLVSFRRASTEVNYRRFFDVADLVGLRVEDPDVFAETHGLILRLVKDGIADGLRVDHIDGLRDPADYLARLRASVAPETPIFVEKILAFGEHLRDSWPVQGTTGYEFLNALEDVFIEPSGFAAIERNYRRWRRLGETTFRDVVRAGKRSVLDGPLHADVEHVVGLIAKSARAAEPRFTSHELSAAVVQLAAALPVYRTYVEPSRPIEQADRDLIEHASREAQSRNGGIAASVAFIAGILLGETPLIDATTRAEFVRRFQQLTGPAAAKGLEDNALYVYVPLASRNEVGGAPDRPLDDAVVQLHDANSRRAARWPHGLLCTTTHDTKRSADIRSRLDALSEWPNDWARAVHRWRRLNHKHRRVLKGRMAPDSNTEYVFYQTLMALWPPPRQGRRTDDLPDRRWRESARDRLTQYMLKAAREARTRTSWSDPDAAYEQATADFVAAVLEPADDAPFLTDVARFVSLIAPAGASNALSRIAVHLTAPGTSDIYQGDELWNFVLVDPDNRRAVDYEVRSKAAGELDAIENSLRSTTPIDPYDHRLKVFVTARLLQARRINADLFTQGNYVPLSATGQRARHVIAFARELDGRYAITVVPRLTGALVSNPAPNWWADTTVTLPAGMRNRCWQSQVISGDVPAGDSIAIEGLFRKLPMLVAVG